MNDLKFEDICNQWYNGNRKHTFELMLENNFDDANTIIDEYLKMPRHLRFISWNDIGRMIEGVILLKSLMIYDIDILNRIKKLKKEI